MEKRASVWSRIDRRMTAVDEWMASSHKFKVIMLCLLWAGAAGAVTIMWIAHWLDGLRLMCVAGVMAIGLGILSLAVFLQARQGAREEREKSGKCFFCGYDLRASPVRCPECGKRVVGPRPRR